MLIEMRRNSYFAKDFILRIISLPFSCQWSNCQSYARALFVYQRSRGLSSVRDTNFARNIVFVRFTVRYAIYFNFAVCRDERIDWRVT